MSDEQNNKQEKTGGLGGLLSGAAAAGGGLAKDLGGEALNGVTNTASLAGGAAKGLSQDGIAKLASLLGTATGAGSQLGGKITGLAGASAGKVEELPVVGPVVKGIATKLGITTNQAVAIVSGALTMLTAKMKRSNIDNADDIDFDNWDEEFADETDVVSDVAEETGLSEEQVTEGVQEAMKMVAESDADEDTGSEEDA